MARLGTPAVPLMCKLQVLGMATFTSEIPPAKVRLGDPALEAILYGCLRQKARLVHILLNAQAIGIHQ